MTLASSQKREGASDVETPETPGSLPLNQATSARHGVDYREGMDPSQVTPLGILTRKTVTIVSGPVSLRVLALWGVIIFAAGFFDGRQISKLGNVAVTPIPSAVSSTSATLAAPAQRQSNAAQPAHVTIRLLKFSPQAIEVEAGEMVEWENSDLTPHTVTSEGGSDLNSGSIDAGGTWRHTFTQPGTFAYFCTFHPEMKGSVIVK